MASFIQHYVYDIHDIAFNFSSLFSLLYNIKCISISQFIILLTVDGYLGWYKVWLFE